jgi:UDP-2-acetamido-3-amino-2,3-dideoxy-glucuronate N-acetyltransferase
MEKSSIASDFIFGANFVIGQYSVIEEDVIVGDNVRIGHHVVLKSGTRIGSNVVFADYACTTGACVLGDNINIRTQAVISKAVILEDFVYIGPGVMTNHTKLVKHMRPNLPREVKITRIGFGGIIGSRVEILAGVSLCPNVMVGGTSLITKDITSSGIYFGMPVKFYSTLPEEFLLKGNSQAYQFSDDIIEKYLPDLNSTP